jgi:predicted permease
MEHGCMDIVSTILPLFLIIALGAFLKIIKVADDSWIKALNNFALYVAFPALIFNSFVTLKEVESSLFFGNMLLLLAVAVVIILFLWKQSKEIRNTYLICVVFGNIAYLGFPFITSLIFGSEQTVGIIIASSLIVFFGFIIAYMDFSKHRTFNIKRLLKNPLLLAVALGCLVSISKVQLPAFLMKALSMLASSASPTALIALGLFLARKIEIDSSFWHAVAITTLKLLVLPTVFYFVDRSWTIAIIEAAMPVAVTTFSLAEEYPMDKKATLYSIILSTVISAITLPLISSFLL